MQAETNIGSQYSILKFTRQLILLQHKKTLDIYQYYQLPVEPKKVSQFQHASLENALRFGRSLLYPRSLSTLENEFNNRSRAYHKQPFQQIQILNTFLPLFNMLNEMHGKGEKHGLITMKSIIIDKTGEIKLRDNLYNPEKITQSQKKQNTDIKQLSLLLLQCCLLKKVPKQPSQEDVNQFLKDIAKNYSRKIFYTALVCLKDLNSFQKVPEWLQKENTPIDHQLETIYQNIKQKLKEKTYSLEKVTNPQLSFQNTQVVSSNLNQISPTKKFFISSHHRKMTNKREDTQNTLANNPEYAKETQQEQLKKKQIDKITKIIERSNAFVNDLLTRKNNNDFLKKTLNSTRTTSHFATNISLNLDNSRRKNTKDIINCSSPMKRLRTPLKK